MEERRNTIISIIKFLNNGCKASVWLYERVCFRWFPRIVKKEKNHV